MVGDTWFRRLNRRLIFDRFRRIIRLSDKAQHWLDQQVSRDKGNLLFPAEVWHGGDQIFLMIPLLLKGFFLGWSVGWPPGPINAEMIRRGLERGFLPAWLVGLGACSGDFLWAVAVSLGAGALMNLPGVRPVLGVVSVVLLLFLAWTFGKGAWRAWHRSRLPAGESVGAVPAGRFGSTRGGYLLGLTMALTSPWNVAFWLGVVGSQAGGALGLAGSLTLAAAVVAGAATWGLVLCGAVQTGARFATPMWHVVTQGVTALLMLFFAGQTVARLVGGS